MIREITATAFDSEIASGKTLTLFSASWCGACKVLHPVLEAFSEEHSELKVVKIDVDDAHELATEYGVRSIPCLIYFEDGNEGRSHFGTATKEMLTKLIAQ